MEEDRPMGGIRGCLAVVVAGVLLTPAAAEAATVDRDPVTGVIVIVDDVAQADDITVERTSTIDRITRVGGGLTVGGASRCAGGGAAPVECPRGSSFSVDLGAGGDRFRAVTVSAPI